jgi:pyridoxal 5'-phosphate synthase pdxS subunit
MAKRRIGYLSKRKSWKRLKGFHRRKRSVDARDEPITLTSRRSKCCSCGCRDPGEALRRIAEGAAMIHPRRSGHGQYCRSGAAHAFGHGHAPRADDGQGIGGAWQEIARLTSSCAGAREGKLPVPNFAAGGIATPADAAS